MKGSGKGSLNMNKAYVRVEFVREKRGLGIPKELDRLLKDVVCRTVESELGDAVPFCVTITYTDNENIRKLNAEYRDIDKATDVLSFPMLYFKDGTPIDSIEEEADPDTGLTYLGDIVISVERAREQAESYGHSFEREMGFLTAHSVLHLLGFDHITDAERAVMEKKQSDILNNMGLTRNIT